MVTPTLGKSPFLLEAIKSISYLPGNVEHIIVCPLDAKKLIPLTSPFSRIVTEPIGESAGMYAAINIGIAAAKNEYDFFCYLNDDDYFLDQISLISDLISNDDVIYYGKTQMVDEVGKPLYLAPFSRFSNMAPLFFKNRIVSFMQPSMIVPATIIKKIGNFNSGFRYCGDFDFILRAIYSGTVFKFLNYRTSAFRLHKGQLSGYSDRMENEISVIYSKYNVSSVKKTFIGLFFKSIFTLLNVGSYVQRYVSTNKLTSKGVFYDS